MKNQTQLLILCEIDDQNNVRMNVMAKDSLLYGRNSSGKSTIAKAIWMTKGEEQQSKVMAGMAVMEIRSIQQGMIKRI